MTNMKEAIDAYDKRYYGGKGLEILKKLGSNLKNPQGHDIFHVISSGALSVMQDQPDIMERFKHLERKGFISRLAGKKAEVLNEIYQETFIRLAKGEDVSAETMRDRLDKYFETASNLLGVYKTCYVVVGRMSHIPELNSLIKSYRWKGKEEPSVFPTDYEIEFHIGKAKVLYSNLRDSHPECFLPDGKMNTDAMLDLDMQEFAIDNFTDEEKLQLNRVELNGSNRWGMRNILFTNKRRLSPIDSLRQ